MSQCFEVIKLWGFSLKSLASPEHVLMNSLRILREHIFCLSGETSIVVSLNGKHLQVFSRGLVQEGIVRHFLLPVGHLPVEHLPVGHLPVEH